MIYNYIEQKAEKLLLESGQTSSPIDLLTCAGHLNIEVTSATLEEDVSGFLLLNGGETHIAYNETHPEHRNRFTIAHEIGHFLLHSKKQTPVFIDKIKYNRDSNSATGEYYIEREANAFAAALLMPKPLIESKVRELGQNYDDEQLVVELADAFNVSNQAMKIRLANLGILDYEL